MPTYEALPRFWRDWSRLTSERQRHFQVAVARFVEDLQRGGRFRPGLRVRGVEGAEGVFEMTWADDGRATTFHYGEQQRESEPHVVWRRIGTHGIFTSP